MARYVWIFPLVLSLFGDTAFAEGAPAKDRHGSSVRSNLEAQILNPVTANGKPSPNKFDGPKAEQVLKEYRTQQGEATGEGVIENMGGD